MTAKKICNADRMGLIWQWPPSTVLAGADEKLTHGFNKIKTI
jgi:hypothetical protein